MSDWEVEIMEPAEMYRLAATEPGRQVLAEYILRSRIVMTLRAVSRLLGIRPRQMQMQSACEALFEVVSNAPACDCGPGECFARSVDGIVSCLGGAQRDGVSELVVLMVWDRIYGRPVEVIVEYAQAIAEGGCPGEDSGSA